MRDYRLPMDGAYEKPFHRSRMRHYTDLVLQMTGGITFAVVAVCAFSSSARDYFIHRLKDATQVEPSTQPSLSPRAAGVASSPIPTTSGADPEPTAANVMQLTNVLAGFFGVIFELQQLLAAKSSEVALVDEHNKRTHRLMMSFLFPPRNQPLRAVQAPELLDHPLVPMTPEAGLDTANATMVRVEDRAGKLHALVLGIDSSKWVHGDLVGGGLRSVNTNALEGAWRWLYATAVECFQRGETVGERSIPVYVLHRRLIVENALDADRPNFLSVSPGEMDATFPMGLMSRVEKRSTGEEVKGMPATEMSMKTRIIGAERR